MNKAIFITVRTGSTRLPKKCLLKVNGKTNIEFLIERLKRSKKADMIVLCTTKLPEDTILCNIARKNGIKVFRGSVKDKLERWLGAAKKYDADFFVTADGDDLFSEPKLIDLAFKQYEKTKCDFIEEKPGASVPTGAFVCGVNVSALKVICALKSSKDTEMINKYFTQPNCFKVEKLKNIPLVLRRPEIRMTLDYKEDFKFFKTIIKHFVGEYFTLGDVIEYLDKHPEIIKINKFRHKDYLENQKRIIERELKNEKFN